MREPKKRNIYSNYDLDEMFDDVRQKVIDREKNLPKRLSGTKSMRWIT